MNTIQKPISELTKKELNILAQNKMNEQKEQLRKDLEDIETVYVSYLNDSGSEMQFWYILEESGRKPQLVKVWISPPMIYDTVNHEVIDLPFNDKPSSWGKSRSGQYHSCFKASGYGYSKSDHCIKSLFYWLGYNDEDIYTNHKLPRVETLN